MAPNILITGAQGLVGSELSKQLGARAVALSRNECDITDARALENLFSLYRPLAIFNCAAMTNVDLCETQEDMAYAINAEAVSCLAHLCNTFKTTLVHFSTDYIFDGTNTTPVPEEHRPNPISVYGKSKLAGEDAVRECHDWIIARTQLVFGSARHNFISDTAHKLQNGQEIRAFSDQIGAPSYAVDIASMAIALLDGNHRGVFHVVNDGTANRVEAAQEVARQLHIQAPQITSVLLKHLKLPAPRPLNCRLSVDKIRHLGINPPAWNDAVSRFLYEAKFL